MEPLDLTIAPPRGPREKALGLMFLPRTIDKMRAQLPGGNLGGYLVDYSRGLSAFVLKRVGVNIEAMKVVVASAPDEAAVLAWFLEHADLSDVERLNAKLQSFSTEPLSDDDRAMVRAAHPGIADRLEITSLFDIFEVDDARSIGSKG
jgi:hypothetical protein